MDANDWPLLPTINASLNATSGVLLTAGFICIKKRKIAAHKACMIAAGVVTACFLCCYLYYHFTTQLLTKFLGEGFIRYVYYTILITHTTLAVVNLPLAITTYVRAFKGQLEKHKRLARITLPIWWYVSITGVLVYFMLYHWFPHGQG